MDFTDLENDEDFKGLSFREQLDVKGGIADEYLSQNEPEYALLSPNDKSDVLTSIIYSPPVFKDGKMNEQVKGLYSQIQNDDPGRKAKLGEWIPTFYQQEEMRKKSLIGALTTSLIDPLSKTLDKFIFDPKDEVLTLEESRRHPEYDKLREFVYGEINRNPEKWGDSINWSNGINNVIMGGELIALYGKYAGSTFNPKGLAKPVMDVISTGIKNSSSAITKSLLSLSKPVAHAAITTAMGASRELAIETLTQLGNENFEAQKTLLNIESKLPTYFAIDIAANFVLDILAPTAWGMGKIFSSGFNQGLKEDAKMALESVLTGKDIGKTLLDRLPEVKENAEYLQTYFKTLKNVEKASTSDLAQAYALKFGFKPRVEGDKISLSLIGEKKKIFSGSPEETLRFIKEKIFESSTLNDKGKVVMGAGKNSFTVQNVIERTVAPEHTGSAQVLTNLLSPVGGKYNQQKLTGFVKTFLKAQDAGEQVLKSVKVVRIDTAPVVEVGLKQEGVRYIGKEGGEKLLRSSKPMLNIEVNGKVVYSVPENITSAEMEREIAKGLTEKLGGFNRSVKDISTNFVEGYTKQVKAQRLYTPEWIEGTVKRLEGDKARVIFENEGRVSVIGLRGKETYNSVEELVNKLNKETLSIEDLNAYLKKNYAVGLKKVGEDGTLNLVNLRSDKVVGSYKDLDDFYNNSGSITPKLSSDLAPKVFITDSNAVKISFVQNTASGQYHQILSEMDRYLGKTVPVKSIDLSFIPSSQGKTLIQFNDSSAVKSVNVFYPELNHTETFSSIKDAKKALVGGRREFEELSNIAGQKGLYLDSYAGKYTVVTPEGKTIVYKDIAELEGALKKIPNNPDYAPEFTGLSDDVVQGISGNFSLDPKGYVSRKFVENGALTSKGLRNEFNSNSYFIYTTTMERYLAKSIARGESIEAQKLFYKIRDTRNLVHVEDVQLADFVDKTFKINGREIPLKIQAKMIEYLEAPKGAKDEVLKALSPSERESVKLVESFFGGSEREGAYKKYASQFIDFRENYAPRIREWVAKGENKKLAESLTPKQLLEKIFGEDKKTVSAFFRHSRSNDIIDIARDMDLKSSVLKYGKVGNRALYMAPLWEELGEMIKKGEGISPMTKMRLANYQGEIMGTFKLPMEKITNETLVKYYDEINKGATRAKFTLKEIEGFAQAAVGWHYSALMAFKGFLPVRNMLQPWMTIAPMLGNDSVILAQKALMADKSGEIFKSLKQAGIIRGEMPLFEGEVFATGLVNKYFQSGMKWFKNSDDFTRGVGAVAAWKRFDEGWGEYLKSGKKMSNEEFLKKSGMKWLEASRQLQALEMLNKGNVKGARDLFASDMVDKGLFRYQSGENIPAFTNFGAVGRIFGKFGTYSVQYVSHLQNILAKASLDEKIAFGSKLVGNSLLLYGAFKAVGMNGSSLLFYNPLTFVGSPTFDFLYTALQSTSFSFEGDIARGKLLTEAQNLVVPGFLKNAYKGTESILKGDVQKGIYQYLSVSLDKDYFED